MKYVFPGSSRVRMKLRSQSQKNSVVLIIGILMLKRPSESKSAWLDIVSFEKISKYLSSKVFIFLYSSGIFFNHPTTVTVSRL